MSDKAQATACGSCFLCVRRSNQNENYESCCQEATAMKISPKQSPTWFQIWLWRVQIERKLKMWSCLETGLEASRRAKGAPDDFLMVFTFPDTSKMTTLRVLRLQKYGLEGFCEGWGDVFKALFERRPQSIDFSRMSLTKSLFWGVAGAWKSIQNLSHTMFCANLVTKQ